MAWTTSDKVMTYREKFRWFDVFAEMMDGWRRHLGGRNAALLAFFSFLSIFPLILAALTILGFVLEGNADLRDRLIDGALAEIPVVGTDLAKDPEAIQGSFLALAIGLGSALWGSTKAFVGLQFGLDDAWEVPLDDRAGMPAQRGKALVGLAIIGASQVASLVIGAIVSAAGLPAVGNIALVAATVVVNICVIAAMYRFLTSATPTWHDVWLGAIIAGIVFTVLQINGADLVKRFSEGSSDSFATIGIVLGLLTWMSIVALTVIMCAELNAARKRLGDGHRVPDDRDMRLVLRN